MKKAPGDLQSTCAVCSGVHSDVTRCVTTAKCPPNEVRELFTNQCWNNYN